MKMPPIDDSYRALGANLRVSANADQAEMLAVARSSASIVSSMLDERISGETDDAAGTDRIDGDSLVAEELAGSTLEQIEQRKELLGDAYPFEVSGQVLRYTEAGSGAYEFCLELSTMDHAGSEHSGDRVLFELFSARMVGEALGGEFFRTGWPSHNHLERPARLAGVADALSQRCGEWWWSPMPGNPQDPDPAEVKDEGLDFVVWKKWDARPGSLFVAGQCACGRNWRTKFGDLSWDGVSRWWSRPSHVQFTRALAIPYVIPGVNAIGDLSREAGLIFDRVRLSLAASRITTRVQLSTWLEETRRQIPSG